MGTRKARCRVCGKLRRYEGLPSGLVSHAPPCGMCARRQRGPEIPEGATVEGRPIELSEPEIAEAVGEWLRGRGLTGAHTFRLSVEGPRSGSPRFFATVAFLVPIIEGSGETLDAGTRDTQPPSEPDPVVEVLRPAGGGPARAYVDGRLHVDDPFPWDEPSERRPR